MAFWIYKCNARSPEYANATGDWSYVFEHSEAVPWGNTTLSGVDAIERGDILLAFQTDRNELVGLVDVVALKPLKDGHRRLVVRRGERIGAKVLPLKKKDTKIAGIPALQGGPIRTAYAISEVDARRLLTAARAHVWTPAPPKPLSKAERDAVVAALAELPAEERKTYERLLRVVARTAGLRAKVLQVWPAECAACGLELRDHDDNAECEIAHIRDVHAKGLDLIANCVPLCRSHHWAFDRDLWAIHPNTLKIAIAPGTAASSLAALAGKIIERPAKVGDVVPLATEHLVWRWKRWKARHGG
jgi:predicted Zn-ribbon and HTH transcriptional regulator